MRVFRLQLALVLLVNVMTVTATRNAYRNSPNLGPTKPNVDLSRLKLFNTIPLLESYARLHKRLVSCWSKASRFSLQFSVHLSFPSAAPDCMLIISLARSVCRETTISPSGVHRGGDPTWEISVEKSSSRSPAQCA